MLKKEKSNEESLRILILGGSKFMGLNLVEKLVQKNEKENLGLRLYIVNRGNVYWDGLFYDLIKDKEFVKHFKADRNDQDSFIKILITIQQEETALKKQFDYIIDFSCYKKSQLEFLQLIEFKYFIFTSSDSTYNASPIALERDDDFFLNKNSNCKELNEDYANLTEDKEVKNKLKRRDSYGFEKLECEIELKNIFSKLTGKNYIAFRLPDVIGSYDESYRLWYYMEWLKYSPLYPVEMEEVDTVRKLSFVLKGDVVQTIMRIIFDSSLNKENVMNQVYNLACVENMTLMEVLAFTADKIGVKFDYKIVERAHTYYPSVTFGPIDCSKAIKLLGFKPKSLLDSLNEEIDFFSYVGSIKNQQFTQEYKEMLEDLPKEIKKIIKEKEKDKVSTGK